MWITFRTTVLSLIFLGFIILASLNVWPKDPTQHIYEYPAIQQSESRRSVGFYHLWLPNDDTQTERLGRLLNTQLGIIVESAALADTRTVCVKIISESQHLRNYAAGLVRLRLNLPWLT